MRFREIKETQRPGENSNDSLRDKIAQLEKQAEEHKANGVVLDNCDIIASDPKEDLDL